MSPLRLATLGWIIPLVMLASLGLLSHLDRTVPYSEPIGAPPPCYADEHDETICPEQAMTPESPLRKVVSALAVEELMFLFGLVAVGSGLGLSLTAVKRARKTRHENPRDQTAYRLAIAALVLVVGVPVILGMVMFVLLVTFPIRG